MPGNPWEYEPVEDYRKREAAQLAPETPTTPARAAAPSYDPYSPFRTSTGKVTPLSTIFGALQAPTEYVGVPLLGAITAGLQPGRQVYTTPGADPWQQMGEAYQQWRRIEHEREPLFWGEKFITENIIFDPLTWVTMGGLKALGKSQAVLMNALKAAGVKDDAITLAVKASQSVDDVSRIPTALLHLAQSSGIDATDAAKIYKLGKTLRAVDIASSPLEWAGLGSRALGQATSPAARYASKALGAVDWTVTLPFRAAKGAVKAGGEALERAVHPQRLYAVAGELPGLEEIAKTGKTFAFGPTGDEPYELKLKLVELDELVPSHTLGLEANPKFPAELQPRLRGRAASKGQIAEIAQELDPSRLLIDTHQLDTGPMIVGTDNVVESGNARVLALMKARQDVPENWRRYVNELKDIAARYGIDPGQVDAMKAPVLVRQRLTDVDRASFVRAANLGSVLQMSPVEYALEDERALPRNAIELLFAQEGENIEASLQRAQNRPLVEGWLKNLPTEERAALVTSEGTINQLGMQRLKNSLLRRAFPGETGTRIIEAFAESTDLNIKRLESGIYSSLAWLSQLETRVGAGTIDPKYSIGEDLAAAIDRFVRLKREGMSVADYLAQAQMFGRELTPDQEQLLGILHEIATNSRKVREFILSYTDAALKTKAPAQGAMFAGELPERSLLLENARKAIGAPGEEFAGEGLWARRATGEPIEGVAERGLAAGQPPTPEVPVERVAPEVPPAPASTEEAIEAARARAKQPLAWTSAEPVPEPTPPIERTGLEWRGAQVEDIPYERAYDAYRHTVHAPERAARQVQREYIEHMQKVEARLLGIAETPAQRATAVEELERYRQEYVKRMLAYLDAQSRTASAFVAGPSKFPEAQMRRREQTVKKRLNELVDWTERGWSQMRKNVERALPEGMTAVDAARVELKELQDLHERMKQANKIVRKAGLSDVEKAKAIEALGFTPREAMEAVVPDFAGRTGFPSYKLNSTRDKIKRLEARVAELTAMSKQADEIAFEGGYIVDNATADRVQILFDEKPPADVRSELKSHGFNWAPSEGAWQRKRSQDAMDWAQRITGATPSPTEAVPPALPEIPVEARPEVGAVERAAVGEVTPAMRPEIAPETPPAVPPQLPSEPQPVRPQLPSGSQPVRPQLPSGPQPIALLPDGSEMPLNQVPEGEIPRAILPPAEPVTGYQQRLPLGAGGRGGGGGGNDLTYLRDALSARPPEPEGDPLEAAFSRFKEQFYDRLESLKLLEKETGIRAYTLARLVPGSGMAGESYIREFVQPVLRSVGDDIHGLEEYMVLMRSRDLLEINPEAVLPGGMKDPAKAIAQLAEELGPERLGTVERAAEQLWELNDRYILQPLRDEGLISGEAYTAIRGRWPHYIPFYREGFDWPSFTLPTGASKRTGGPANVGEQIIRAISEEGSALPLDEPLARWQAQFIQTQERISRNKAARALIDALESVDPSLVARGATEATGTKGIVNWYEAGKKLSARVPKQYEIAAKALGAESADATTRMLRAMTQPLRVGATQVNPAFMVSNIIRDSMDAWTREGLRPFSQDWLAGVTSAFVHGEEWHEAARAGVLGVGFVERARTTEALKATHRLGEIKLDSIGDALLLIPRLIMQANEIIEQGTRVATFKKLRGEGIEQLEAALRARDVTVDFAKSGNFIKLLNQMIPFLNAGIQGSVNTAKQVATKPVQAIVRSLPLMMVSTLAYLWNQRFETAKDIPDYVYSDHWVIQIGEGIRHPDPKYPDAEPERFPIYIRLPKGPAVSFLTAPAELAMRLAFGRNDRSVVEEILAAGSSTFRAVSPVELSSLTTPGLGTVTQLAANYDIFRQRQIVPEWEMGRPPEERYDVQTSDTAVALGRAFNVSPRIIDFAINDMTGGGGRAAVWLLDLGLGALGYEAPVAAGEARRRPATTAEELVRTPVVGRFLGASGTGAKLVQYERLDKALSAARRTLYKNEEFRRFGLGVNPPGESVTINGVPQQLPPDVRVRIVEMATPLMREALDQLAATDFYAQMDDIQRKKALDHIRGKVQDSVRDYLTGQGGQPITPQEIPYLIEAYRQYLEYESIPTYWGMSEQESELASRAMSQISALRRANPTLPYNVTVQIYAQQDPMGAYLAQIARQRSNPMRQQYWASHPLLSRYYSSADPRLLQTVLMPQTAGYQVPSWAPSGSAEGATPGYAGVAGT